MVNTQQKILVTGINGFVGHHVADKLHERGYGIIGVGNQPTLDQDLEDLATSYYGCDLTNPEEVKQIQLSGVSAIINLAGFAKVGDSNGQGELYNKVNVGVHTVLYDECLRQNVFPRIIAVSTGAVYDAEASMPITETSPLISKDKTNEYVISKQLMEESLQHYRDSGLRVIVARPFNHSGPGQLPGFLLPDLGEQIQVALRNGEPVKVGNIKTRRDYTDVRDVAEAYVLLGTLTDDRLQHDIYNICSGKSTEGTTILDLLRNAFGASSVDVVVDESRIRPHDVMDIFGSRDRLTVDTGWAPKISVKQMVNDYVSWKKVSN